jgi:hypothetical protein
VRRGDGDDDRRAAHRNPADPVNDVDPSGGEPPPGLSLEFLQARERHRPVRLVLQGDDPPALDRVRPDPSDEHHDGSAAGIR